MKNKYGAKRVYCDANLQECKKEDKAYAFRSKLEHTFAKRLNMEIRAGEITSWEYEPDKIEIYDKDKYYKKYIPDFKVYMRVDVSPGCGHGVITRTAYYYVEVKGYLKPGARKLLKLASQQLPHDLYVYSKKHELLPVGEYLKRMRGK